MDDRSMHPGRVVGPRPTPKYEGPNLLQPQLTVMGRTGNVPDLNWLKLNGKHATKVSLEPAPSGSGAEAVLRVEGKHPRTGQFEFRSGFRSRTEARNFADTQLSHVGNRENRLRDGGY
jgi:hypothetical protein